MKLETEGFRGPAYRAGLPGNETKVAVERFRSDHASDLGTNGVIYDAEDIQKYIENVFKPFAAANKPTNQDEKWVVGHYFMIYEERLSFCVLPTLYNEKNHTIIDRYNYGHPTSIYFPTYIKTFDPVLTKSDPPGDGEPFDKGGMWP
jgi:hypothetical protein